MDYITARKRLYYDEHLRLVKQLPEYDELLSSLRNGESLMICEIDVPANGKKGEFGMGCDENNICELSLEN